MVCRGVELSYGELDRRAGRLASYLRARGLRAGQVVALVIDRDLDAYVALVGILKAGGAFAVLDPKLPPEPAGLHDPRHRSAAGDHPLGAGGRLPVPTGWTTVLLDTDWAEVEAAAADAPLAEWSGPESLAYVLYTSGSSGSPKGVMIGTGPWRSSPRRTAGHSASARATGCSSCRH